MNWKLYIIAVPQGQHEQTQSRAMQTEAHDTAHALRKAISAIEDQPGTPPTTTPTVTIAPRHTVTRLLLQLELHHLGWKYPYLRRQIWRCHRRYRQ